MHPHEVLRLEAHDIGADVAGRDLTDDDETRNRGDHHAHRPRTLASTLSRRIIADRVSASVARSIASAISLATWRTRNSANPLRMVRRVSRR